MGDTQSIANDSNGDRAEDLQRMVEYLNHNADVAIQVGDWANGQTATSQYTALKTAWKNFYIPWCGCAGNWDLGLDGGVASSSRDNPNYQRCTQDNGVAALLFTTVTAPDAVTIEGVTYNLVASLGDAYDVLAGSTLQEARDNLVAAINNGPGAGTVYHASTPVNAHVFAVAADSETDGVLMLAYGKPGITGTTIDLSDALTAGGWIDPFTPSSATPVTTLSAALTSYGGIRDLPFFGGYNVDLNCYYILVTACGVDLCIINIPFGPLAADMTWAKSIADAYPARWVILNTHSFIFRNDGLSTIDANGIVERGDNHAPDESTYWGKALPSAAQRRLDIRCGYEMWNDAQDWALSNWDNLKIITNGHHFTTSTKVQGYQKLTGSAGQQVHAFHVNYQGAPSGQIRMINFLDDGSCVVFTYDPTIDTRWQRTIYGAEDFTFQDDEIWQVP